MNDTGTSVNSDNYFAMIPEWVLYSDISANAIRLYCVLRRRADKESGKCYPNRKTLAKEMGGISTRTLDRAVEELEKIGALRVIHRMNGNEYTSNLYTVISTNPSRATTPSDDTDALGGDIYALGSDTDALGSAKDGEQTRVIKPKTFNQSKKDIPHPNFDEFWKFYPLKRDKGAAIRAFPKALEKVGLEEIMAGVDRLVSDPNLEMKYCPYPATWLNGERWTDAPLPGRESRSEKFLKEFRQESAWLELE